MASAAIDIDTPEDLLEMVPRGKKSFYLTGLRRRSNIVSMLDFNPLSLSLPQALASALRRLTHLAHTSSWDQWAVQRLTPTQRRILDVVASRRESLTLSALAGSSALPPLRPPTVSVPWNPKV